MPEIGIKYVELTELNEIIKTNFSGNSIAILERWFCGEKDKPDFFDHLSKLTGNASEWDKGRVFDKTSELKWEKEKGKFHLVWIADQEDIQDGWSKEEIDFVDSHEVLLWGKQIAKDQWYEKQIPRIFDYPAKNGARVYAILNEYLFKDGSKYYRFKEVCVK